MTKRLNEFVQEVATVAVSDVEETTSFSEFVSEYTDQIESDDYLCVVTYANEIGIKIPRALKSVLKM